MIKPKQKNRARSDLVQRLMSALLLLLPLLATASSPVIAGAQVSVTPTRVVFEGRTRTASVTLINRGNETSTFRISFERKRMTEDGQFEDIKDPKPGEVFSDEMIRFSPRQVVLAPGKTQVIRLLLRKPPNLKDGEYRSHMLFREIPEQTSTSIESQTSNKKEMIISIKPVLGISIPVIVRQGAASAEAQFVKAELKEISPDKSKASLFLVIKRSGNHSVYGDIVATYHKSENDKNSFVVGQVNGIAVYTPNATRALTLNLQAPAGVQLDGGRVDIVFRASATDGNKLLAQSRAEVPASK